MTKILIDEATVKLALEGIESMTSWEHPDDPAHPWTDCAKLLRDALAEQPAQQCKWPTCQSEEAQQALAEQLKRELVDEQPAQQEPFGYFKAEPFGWTDCAETDEGAVALYTTPQPAQRIAELEALLERQTARIVDLQTHIDNLDGEDR